MFGVVCFPELGRDTGPCETQIVVLSIVHAQTQNYNVTFFVRSRYENKPKRSWIPKISIYTTFHKSLQAVLVEWLKPTIVNHLS
jgi:hypothetical protein